MRSLFLAATVAALLGSAAAQPVAAYTIDGSVNGLNQYASPTFVSGPFSDAFSFSLTETSNVNASFTGNPGTAFKLSDFSIYDATTNAKETATFTSFLVGPNFFAGTDTVQLMAGNYYIGVTGTSSSTKGTYTGTLAVTAVPLPSSVALFGLSVVGCAVIGFGRKRSRGFGIAQRAA